MTMKHYFTIAAVAFMSVSAIASDPVSVSQKGLAFSPNDLSVEKAQTVEFVNDDNTAHNVIVTGDGVSFNGGLQAPGAHLKYTFAKPGTYAITCGIHPKMKLSVTVK